METICYKQQVKIIYGFYKGQIGKVVDFKTGFLCDKCTIELNDGNRIDLRSINGVSSLSNLEPI